MPLSLKYFTVKTKQLKLPNITFNLLWKNSQTMNGKEIYSQIINLFLLEPFA